jgi:hypothetical protein
MKEKKGGGNYAVFYLEFCFCNIYDVITPGRKKKGAAN